MVTLLFRFDAQSGVIESVRAEARGRTVGKTHRHDAVGRPLVRLRRARRPACADARRGGVDHARGTQTVLAR
ncbi:MAG: hypothetical protein MZW92_41145 [Comamonadaceae bacterium]|nr:hypothetical protein [Comamonadaceae bacterium]